MGTKRHGYFVEMKRIANASFDRWCLRNSQQRYWTGKDWVDDRARALIYADEGECKLDLINLTFQMPPKKYEVPMTIQVDASRDFTIEQMRDYVRRNFKWKLKDDHGISPLDTANFYLQIDVEALRPLLPEGFFDGEKE